MLTALTALSAASCRPASPGAATPEDWLETLYVADFQTEAPEQCGSGDIDLSHAQAREFFRRAREVEYGVIHDHYEVAPCWVEGVVSYRGEACEWRIRPGATASIRCGDVTRYFVCDESGELLEPE